MRHEFELTLFVRLVYSLLSNLPHASRKCVVWLLTGAFFDGRRLAFPFTGKMHEWLPELLELDDVNR